jgi:phage terminase large subunit-like protein
MQLTKLQQLYETCRTLPNYQYKNLSEEELLVKANKSFQKLPPLQKEKVIKSWNKKLAKEGIVTTAEEAFNDLLKYRFLSQTNLFFLCHLLELYNNTTINTHEEICNSFFVQKDPTFITFDHFADQYTDLKQRVLLVPRGGFKSSIDMADCIQWIICFPAITIAILTGVLQLAKDFVGEVKQHCTYTESGTDSKGKSSYDVRQIMDKQTGDWSDSIFQVLFPEHCLSPLEGNQLEFQTPAAEESKEPSVRAASIDQALSGSHYNVLKLDDVVTNENTKTEARIKDTIKQISIDNGLLNPNGFYDVIGTWYDERDYYGVTIRKTEKRAKDEGLLESIQGSIDSGRFNANLSYKIYLRAAWWPTQDAVKAGKIEEELTKSDLELWFPERLSYEFLLGKLKDDSDNDDDEGDTGYFAIKYLNNPRKANRVRFPRELLKRRTIPHSQFPPQGIVVTTVDTAYSTKSWADYTVIITALIFGGRFYVINMVRGRFNEYELPKIIANTASTWKPKRIAIEDSVGVKWMARELRREMDNLKISIPVEFVSLGLGSKLRSKQLKAKPVLRLLGDERMYFLNSCEGLEEIYNELEKFTGTGDDAHDDIVSAMSLLVEQFIGYADMDSRINSINSDYISNQQSKSIHDQIYCLGQYAKYNEMGLIDDNPVTQFQAQQAAQNINDDPYIDPFADLMR